MWSVLALALVDASVRRQLSDPTASQQALQEVGCGCDLADGVYGIGSMRFEEYLYAGQPQYDSKRRRVLTFHEGTPADDVSMKWTFKRYGEHFAIGSVRFGEWMYAGVPQLDEEHHHVLTWHEGNPVANGDTHSLWRIQKFGDYHGIQNVDSGEWMGAGDAKHTEFRRHVLTYTDGSPDGNDDLLWTIRRLDEPAPTTTSLLGTPSHTAQTSPKSPTLSVGGFVVTDWPEGDPATKVGVLEEKPFPGFTVLDPTEPIDFDKTGTRAAMHCKSKACCQYMDTMWFEFRRRDACQETEHCHWVQEAVAGRQCKWVAPEDPVLGLDLETGRIDCRGEEAGKQECCQQFDEVRNKATACDAAVGCRWHARPWYQPSCIGSGHCMSVGQTGVDKDCTGQEEECCKDLDVDVCNDVKGCRYKRHRRFWHFCARLKSQEEGK